MIERETIDKLFLELSQFTTARTARELAYREVLESIANGELDAEQARTKAKTTILEQES